MKKLGLGVMVFSIAFSAHAENVSSPSLFEGIFAGLGIGASFLKTCDIIIGYKDPEKKEPIVRDFSADRFVGSFVIGGGKVFHKVYGGIEVLCDIMKNEGHEIYGKNIHQKGLIPQLNVKIGYIPNLNVMAYMKLGCAWSRGSVNVAEEVNNTKTKVALVLGAGIERAFHNRVSTALEVDCNFGGRYSNANTSDTRVNKGWNARALIKYNLVL